MKTVFSIYLIIYIAVSFENMFCQDYTTENDSTTILNDTKDQSAGPIFYTNSNLLVGAEIIDPLQPDKFFSRTTQLWKTDIQIGMFYPITPDIITFFSIRDNDSPTTNNVGIYEAGVKVNHDWGKILFGQKRFQSGNKSFYLNDAFDRSFWNIGLIYDFIMRGITSTFNVTKNSEVELFLGSELSASFIGGLNYGIELFHGWDVKTSALYIARDPKYSAFGFQYGIESQESFKNFFSYQVISYKVFDQEPNPFRELTIFAEGRYIYEYDWSFGIAGLFTRLSDLGPDRDEFRYSLDIRYKLTTTVDFGVQTELFDVDDFTEIHLGTALYLNYFDGVRIVPRIRYILTEFGDDILFIGLEGKIIIGELE